MIENFDQDLVTKCVRLVDYNIFLRISSSTSAKNYENQLTCQFKVTSKDKVGPFMRHSVYILLLQISCSVCCTVERVKFFGPQCITFCNCVPYFYRLHSSDLIFDVFFLVQHPSSYMDLFPPRLFLFQFVI